MTVTIRKGCDTVSRASQGTMSVWRCSNDSSVTTNSRSIKHYRDTRAEESAGGDVRLDNRCCLGQLCSIGAMHGEIERQPDRERERVDHDRHQHGNTEERQHHRPHWNVGGRGDEPDRHRHCQHDECEDRIDGDRTEFETLFTPPANAACPASFVLAQPPPDERSSRPAPRAVQQQRPTQHPTE